MSNEQVTVSVRLPKNVVEIIDKQTESLVGTTIYKVKDRSDVLREAIIAGIKARGWATEVS